MSIILALLAALFASMTNILAKIGMENVNTNLATAVRTIVVLILAFLMVLITGKFGTIAAIQPKAMLFIILSGFATGLSWLFFFKALGIGEVSKVVPIDKSSIVLTIILSILLLGEPAAPQILAGGALITIGTFVLIGKNEDKKRFTGSQSYIVYAILGAVFAALTSILAKIGMEGVDSNVATFLRTIVILLFAWAIVFYQKTYREMKTISSKGYLFLILSGAATGLSWLCYFGALAIGKVSIVAPIDKFSVVITMILSFVILKEKARKHTIVGGAIITLGTVFLVF
ncbi:EamA family transporter [Bacillus infantis]|uniref:EamA family transporter n=1 Tax=Bacillus infantis TaxID=324767 RepID=A0A5D4S6S6_9BACI|nr:EamA family transporter [Bacillus infantis]MCK6207164.1 EamA family transporter [Bacillus infantis]OXT16185.1 multidrug DMT transporter permease [Bacillus sp. OG2]RYI27537.1 EamA family transporter [Bacillus infantis]TYS59395.1 EamA family transporter [Bacillus infantis]